MSVSLFFAAMASLRADKGFAVCNGLQHALEETSHSTAIAFADGVKRMGIIRVDFEDLPGTPGDTGGEFTTSRLLETVNGPVASYFEATSYGKSSVALKASDITDVLRMPDTAEGYAKDALLSRLTLDARRLASEAGYAIEGFDRVAVVTSSLASLPGSGVRFRATAVTGGGQSWFQGDFSATLVANELGHNYGHEPCVFVAGPGWTG